MFTSCGSDDEYQELTVNGVCKQNVSLEGKKDQTVTEPKVEANLEEMLKAATSGYDGTRIASGSLNITGSTYVKITGLKDGVTLKNLKIKLNGQEKNFGDITSQKANLYTDEHLEFFKAAFNRMVSQHSWVIEVTHSPSEDITAEDNVKIEFSFDGSFKYNKKV